MNKIDKEAMKLGYIEMGKINLLISHELEKVELGEYFKMEGKLKDE